MFTYLGHWQKMSFLSEKNRNSHRFWIFQKKREPKIERNKTSFKILNMFYLEISLLRIYVVYN